MQIESFAQYIFIYLYSFTFIALFTAIGVLLIPIFVDKEYINWFVKHLAIPLCVVLIGLLLMLTITAIIAKNGFIFHF